MNDREHHRPTDDEVDRESYRINAVNPSQIELRLALEPGGPESLQEAVERVLNGKPLVRPAGNAAPLWAEESAEFMEPPGGEAPPNLPEQEDR